MNKLELTLHPEKTKLVYLWDGKEGFDFLGMHHRKCRYQMGDGRICYPVMQWPSRKAEQKIRDTIKEFLGNRSTLKMSTNEIIKWLNSRIRGWGNYYGTRFAGKILWKLDKYILKRVTLWHNEKIQQRNRLRGMKYYYMKLRELGMLMLSEFAC